MNEGVRLLASNPCHSPSMRNTPFLFASSASTRHSAALSVAG